MRYEIVPATWEHALALAPKMRAADIEEVAANGRGPLEALEVSVAASRDAYAGLVDGRVVCMFGVSTATLTSDVAIPWLLASDEMVRHSRVFLRLNRAYIAGLRRKFRLLHNYVGASNAVAIRWLRWLGFSVSETETQIGDNRTPMYYFEMINV